MVAIAHNAKLNDLVIDLGRSLLQYAYEGSAWTADSMAAKRLEDCAAAQQADVGRLVNFLMDRGWPVDQGTYPTDFTDLQFLSLAYFLPRLRQDQQRLVDDLDEAVHTCVDDPEAVALLREIVASERQIATDLAVLSAGGNGAPVMA